MNVSKARIKNAEGRTMGHKYGLWTKPGRKLSKIASNISVWFFERAAHEWQGVLVTYKRKTSTIYLAPVDRLNPV